MDLRSAASIVSIGTLLLLIIFMHTSIASAQTSWISVAGPGGGEIVALVRSGETVLAGSNGSGIYRTTNKGLSWTLADNGITSTMSIHKLAVTGDTMYATSTKGMFRSVDAGIHWSGIDAVPQGASFVAANAHMALATA